jgi:hypothetical protein
MTAAPTEPSSAASAAKRLATIVVVLAAVFGAVSVMLRPDSFRSTAIRVLAIVLTGVLVARGMRWARLLLVFLTGLGALYAALLGVVRPLSLGWRVWFLAYGIGTLWCLWALFRQPAAAYFTQPPSQEKGGA